MSLWHDIKVRLGLADDWDDEYYDDDEYEVGDNADAQDAAPAYREEPYKSPYGASGPGVRRIDRAGDFGHRENLRSVPTGAASVTPVAPQVKMHIVEPKSFVEAQTIADKFKQGTPVIMNLSMTKPDLAKRLIDFASGLTYGLEGGLQKVSDKVFMLTPHNVEVSDADRRRLQTTGIFSAE